MFSLRRVASALIDPLALAAFGLFLITALHCNAQSCSGGSCGAGGGRSMGGYGGYGYQFAQPSYQYIQQPTYSSASLSPDGNTLYSDGKTYSMCPDGKFREATTKIGSGGFPADGWYLHESGFLENYEQGRCVRCIRKDDPQYARAIERFKAVVLGVGAKASVGCDPVACSGPAACNVGGACNNACGACQANDKRVAALEAKVEKLESTVTSQTKLLMSISSKLDTMAETQAKFNPFVVTK